MPCALDPQSLDPQGFLADPRRWNESIASLLAADEGIELTEAHWQVIRVLRQFYQTHDMAPANRMLVKLVAAQLGPDCGNSRYLMQLFPGSPARRAARIAGLPKPLNCL